MTAIISRTTIKNPTNNQAAPNIMQKQNANSSDSCFEFVIFMLEPEKHSKNQILNRKLHNASDAE